MTQEQTEGSPKPYEIIAAPRPLDEVEISSGALTVLEQYSGIAHERITLGRAGRRTDILRDFMGSDSPEWIIDVAALAELAERAADESSVHRNSRRYINRYMLTKEGDPSNIPTIRALAGLSYVEEKLGSKSRSKRNLGMAATDKPEARVRKTPHRRGILAQGVDRPWAEELDEIQLADPETMLKLTDQNLFVPLLVKSAECLDMLANRREITKTDAKRYARDALEVYTPFCEIIGYDGFANALSNAANGLKVEGRKNYDELVAEVVGEEYQSMFSGDNHLLAISKVLDLNTAIFDSTVGTSSNAHDVKLGAFTGELDGIEIDGRYRVKGLNTLINKLFSKDYSDYKAVEDKLPMDMLGITFIANSVEESALLMSKLLERVAQHDSFTPKATVDRREFEQGHIHVQGTGDFINHICKWIGVDAENISCNELTPDDYEVAKVTFLTKVNGQEIPTEVQIVTREARDNGRRGLVGHLLFKLFGKLSDEDVGMRSKREKVSAIIKAIHSQKKRMKEPIPDTSVTTLFINSFIELCRRAGV